MVSFLSSALLILIAGVTSAQQRIGDQPYLAPHEQQAFDALENVNKDYNAFMKIFANNAFCEITFGKESDDVTVKSGPCRDVFRNYGNMAEYKVRWHPLTNSHPKHPEKGVLSLMWGNYGLTKRGCEGLFFGTGEIKFNIEGKVTDWRGHSTEFLDFMNCVEGNKSERTVQEEIYLAPHEQDLYDALDNIHEDFEAFTAVFADNAQCDVVSGQAPTDIAMKSGPCKEVWKDWENVVHNKIKWVPVTNTHAKRPEKGVLATHFWHYALTDNGCESFYFGTGTVTFNKDGLVTRLRSNSNGLMEFLDCINQVAVKTE